MAPGWVKPPCPHQAPLPKEPPSLGLYPLRCLSNPSDCRGGRASRRPPPYLAADGFVHGSRSGRARPGRAGGQEAAGLLAGAAETQAHDSPSPGFRSRTRSDGDSAAADAAPEQDPVTPLATARDGGGGGSVREGSSGTEAGRGPAAREALVKARRFCPA